MVAARTSTLTMENIRCFSKEAIVLRPLTIMLGENGTGKTTALGCHQTALSLLSKPKRNSIMAPFNQVPYEMGLFNNIVREERTDYHFKSNNEIVLTHRFEELECKSSFVESADGLAELSGISLTIPEYNDVVLELLPGKELKVNQIKGYDGNKLCVTVARDSIRMYDLRSYLENSILPHINDPAIIDSRSISIETANRFINKMMEALPEIGLLSIPARKPKSKRIYDYTRCLDPEPDEELPFLLFELWQKKQDVFKELACRIKDFGKATRMFEEFDIRTSPEGNDKFEIVVMRDGKQINIHDLGSGLWPALVQLLMVESEILLNGTQHFHLQHLEAFSHPRLHAEFIKWLCNKVDDGFDFIIETHSDYALLRLTIEVCDNHIDSEEIAIACFEHKPQDRKCTIHNLQLGENGMIIDPPHCYERFYYDETKEYLMASPKS